MDTGPYFHETIDESIGTVRILFDRKVFIDFSQQYH